MTAEERHELIHRPFIITRFGPSYPHGGTAVTDNFFNPEFPGWAAREWDSDTDRLVKFKNGGLAAKRLRKADHTTP